MRFIFTDLGNHVCNCVEQLGCCSPLSAFFALLNVMKCRFVAEVAAVACSGCWNQHPISMFMTCSQKYWTSKILADSEILTDFTSRTWILAYSGLWTNELCLSLFTYPHYLKATVSIKLVQEYPHSHAHGGPKSIALKADLFLQLLGCLISFSLYEEKLSWDGHLDTMESLKSSLKNVGNMHFQSILQSIPQKHKFTWNIIWIHHK